MSVESEDIIDLYERRADAWVQARLLESTLYEKPWLDRFCSLLPSGGSVLDGGCVFHDKRAVECARLLAVECDASDPSTGLYGEGLAIALLSACFHGRPPKENSGLSVSQLRLVLDFIHEHLDASVSIFQLARLVDLSSSQFARMFKASTGVSPHRYRLNTRIGKAQELLLMKGESLSMVAVATGFADQSHFTRTFKRSLELHHTSGIRIAPLIDFRQGRISTGDNRPNHLCKTTVGGIAVTIFLNAPFRLIALVNGRRP